MLNKLSRRQFVGGVCTCGLAAALHGPAHAQSTSQGCSLTTDQFRAVVTPTATEFAFAASSAAAAQSGSSGNSAFDQALAITLAKLSRAFGVLPAFSFFTEPDNGINAYASTEITNSKRPDGSVAYGRNLLNWQMGSEQTTLAWVVGVCAHEFAHILQFRRGTASMLERMSNGSVFRTELHADFLAGYFGGLRKLEKPDFPAAELALGMFYVGDDHFTSAGHHGTPQQRGEAVRQGFKYAFERKAAFNETYEAGVQFAKAQTIQN